MNLKEEFKERRTDHPKQRVEINEWGLRRLEDVMIART